MMDLDQAVFGNTEVLEELYARYLKDPLEIDPTWRKTFDLLEKRPVAKPSRVVKSIESPLQGEDRRIEDLIEAYRVYGHLASHINPLQKAPPLPKQLQLDQFDLSEADLQKTFPTYGLLPNAEATLEQLINVLKGIYCNTVGVEYRNYGSEEMQLWLQQRIEPQGFKLGLNVDQKKEILQQLNKSELFEMFLHTKYPGQKRFSLEGGETLIPVMAAIVDKGAELGATEFIIGMAHRGRLNVLSNILNKSYGLIFSEFDENYQQETFDQSGDVKYHKGFFSDTVSSHGHQVKILLAPNPSHLESVDPVVEGQVYARQNLLNGDSKYAKVLPLLIHGDAALSGQGIVYETMQMRSLAGYGTGGTVHLVINNQIGFTTIPSDARSTNYCTDIAKAFGAPVFHVNAEDPESCVFAANLAIELRQRFGCDVFIDILCYRKYGHNETDEPAYTQPHEYSIITKKQSIREIYRDALVRDGSLEKSVVDELESSFKSSLQEELKILASTLKKPLNNYGSERVQNAQNKFNHVLTGVPLQQLQDIAKAAYHIPEGFTLHPKLVKLTTERLAMVSGDETAKVIDWGTAETLAYGSLLWDGVNVRLSGQDSCRGTFSHRHAMWMDQKVEQPYYPLKHLKKGQGLFNVYNSLLSEYAVLAFEFGYSVASPNTLVLWEAQFGDFCNGAQIIIDQYITTAEQKWGQQSSLVLLLPHGYEGQGPEHSSGRMERFMTLAGQNNIRIANPSTPAQMFHLLRRQQFTNEKKPLVVFTPKALLRHPDCVSSPQELTTGCFQEIIDDDTSPAFITKVAICSGHIYYDLLAQRIKDKSDDVALIRVEQLYPFDKERMKELLSKYTVVTDVYWVQEEPRNMGAGAFLLEDLQSSMPPNAKLHFVARPRSASPAVGSYGAHKKQLSDILAAIFGQKQPTIFDIAGQGRDKQRKGK